MNIVEEVIITTVIPFAFSWIIADLLVIRRKLEEAFPESKTDEIEEPNDP